MTEHPPSPDSSPRRRLGPAFALVAIGLVLALAGLTLYLVLARPKSVPDQRKPDEPNEAQVVYPRPPRTLEELALLPSPLDARQRRDLPTARLALAGSGDPTLAPGQLVALLGDEPFALPQENLGGAEVSPDGNLLAVACGGKVLIFDARTGQRLQTFASTSNRLIRAVFSPDSKRLLLAGYGLAGHKPEPELWDLASASRVQSYQGHGDGVISAVFGPEARTVLTGSVDRTVRIWDAASGKQLHSLGHPDHVHGLAVSPDGRFVVTGCNDGLVRVWDFASGQLKQTLPGHTGGVVTVRYSPDGTLLATATSKQLKLWNANGFAPVRTLPGTGAWARFTPDGTILVCTSVERYEEGKPHTLTRWDVSTGEKIAELPLPAQGSWPLFALTPDGTTLFNARTEAPIVLRACDAESATPLSSPLGHLGPVHAVAVSPDGRVLASAGEDRTVRLWDLATDKQLHILQRQTLEIPSLAFSPDGRFLASASKDTTIVLWDVATGSEVRTLAGHASHDAHIAFCPDNRTLAAGGADGKVKLWDIASGKALDPIQWHTGQVRTVAYSPDARLLASGGNDRKVQLVDVPTGRLLHTFPTNDSVLEVHFSADGRQLAARVGATGALVLWDVETRKEIVLPQRPKGVRCLAVHPAGKMFAVGLADASIRLVNLASPGKESRLLRAGGTGVRDLAFTPEGRYLVVANQNGTLSVLRLPPAPGPVPPLVLPDPQELARRPSAADALEPTDVPETLPPQKTPAQLVAVLGDRRFRHDGPVCTVRFLEDDRTLVSFGKDRVVRFWDAGSGKLQRSVRIDTNDFAGYAISPDGRTLALGYDVSGLVVLWDLEKVKIVHQLQGAADRGVIPKGIAFSADGKTMVTGGRWFWSKLWDPASGKELRKLDGHGCNVYNFAFAPDGKTLATTDEDKWVILWDVATGQRGRKLEGHSRAVMAAVFSPDGKTLISGSYDTTAIRWDLATGQALTTFRGHTGPIGAVALNADGTTLATASADHTVKLWDVDTGKERATLSGHSGPVVTLAFTADGKTLASGSDDGSIRLWNLADRADRFPYQGHVGRVLSLAVSPDGTTAATAGADGSIRLWDLATTKVLRVLEARHGAAQVATFSPDGRTLAVGYAEGAIRLWDLTTGKGLLLTEGQKPGTRSIVYSPDGRLLAFARGDGSITLWDVPASRVARKFTGHPGDLPCLAFSPDNTTLVSVGKEGARFWDVAEGWLMEDHRGPAAGYTALACSPDGQTLALGTRERIIELRDTRTWSERARLSTSDAEVTTLSFRPDGRLLASAGPDGVIRVRNPADPTEPEQTLVQLGAPGAPAIAWTPEGRHLLSTAKEGVVCVLRLARTGEVFPTSPAKAP